MPARRRELAEWFHATYQVSTVRACRLAQLSRTAWYRRPQHDPQEALRTRIRESAHARPRFECQRIHVLLRREGRLVNLKRLRRLYRLEGLQVRTRLRRASTGPCTVGPPQPPWGRRIGGA